MTDKVVKIPVVEKTRKEIVLERIQEILKEHDGMESNIPVTKGGEYWSLKREWQELNSK